LESCRAKPRTDGSLSGDPKWNRVPNQSHPAHFVLVRISSMTPPWRQW
jgi:hypothetical protein